MSREESYALIDVCDCYVSLHRSEGFGLTMAEAMLMGKPVIATGYSGNLDFMTPDNSLLVSYERVPVAQNFTFYRKGSVWAAPDLSDAARQMRLGGRESGAGPGAGDASANRVAIVAVPGISRPAHGRTTATNSGWGKGSPRGGLKAALPHAAALRPPLRRTFTTQFPKTQSHPLAHGSEGQ